VLSCPGAAPRGAAPRAVPPGHRWPAVIWWATALFLAFIVIYPFAVLLINSFSEVTITGGAVRRAFTLENYRRVFQDKGILTSMANSARVVIPSTCLATALGVFLAWAAARTDLPGAKVWRLLLAVPYFIPPFIGAVAWTFILGPVGYANRFLTAVFGLTTPVFNIYSVTGMVGVMTVYRYPVAYLVALPVMAQIPASLEESARVSGASSWKAARDITLPLLTPSIVGAAILLFLFVLADFGVSAALGAPNRIRLMTTEIYYLIRRPDLPGGMQTAAALSIFLSVFGLAGLWAHNRALKANRFSVIAGKSAAAEPVRLGAARWAVFAFVLLVFLVSACAPIIAALLTAVTKVYGLPIGPGNLTLGNFAALFTIPNIERAFRNSLFLSAASAAIIAFVTLIVAYAAVRGGIRGVRGVKVMQTLVTLPYALPGTIIAIAMILAFARPLPLTGWKLYGTIWILLAAYLARFMNLGYNNIAGAISQIDPSLEEAARVSGASHLRAFAGVIIPLLRGSLVSSFFLVAAPTLSEVTLSALLWSVGNETIGTVVFNTQEEGKILRAAALAVALIIIVVMVNVAIQALESRRGGRWEKVPGKEAG